MEININYLYQSHYNLVHDISTISLPKSLIKLPLWFNDCAHVEDVAQAVIIINQQKRESYKII